MSTAREEEAIIQTCTNYIQTFQALDPHATLPYFHVPCVFIPPQGVRVAPQRSYGGPQDPQLCAERAKGPPCQTDERERRFCECQ